MSKTINTINKPNWLKVKAFGGEKYMEIMSLMKENNLHTVCQEANCPNRGECFNSGTATFLIMGPNCTRSCRFCDIATGKPLPLDPLEPKRVARAVELMKLKHAVITSVNRDDLPDGGASQFVKVIRLLRRQDNKLTIEVLTPDFRGNEEAILAVLDAAPDVYNHNVETVPRLYKSVRPAAKYEQSLRLLELISGKHVSVKSGLMVGLGETVDELVEVFRDMKRVGVEFLTIGQYLSPSKKHHEVIKYYSPSEFDELADVARGCGIENVFSGPLVRSSYHAGEKFLSK